MPKTKDKSVADLDKLAPPGATVDDDDLKGLTWNDLKWLQDRGKLTERQQRRNGFTPNREGGSWPPGEGPVDEFAQYEQVPDDNDDEGDEEEGDDTEEVEESPYAEWSKPQLQKEIKQRNDLKGPDEQLSTSGTKEVLVQTLEDDDEADEDD